MAKRIQRYFDLYAELLDQYEAEHPDWELETLASLVEDGLRSLRHYLEDPAVPEVTWEDPFVDLQFPVQWDWDARSRKGVIRGGHLFGTLTAENTTTEKAASLALAGILTEQLVVLTLSAATNGVWFEKRRGRYTPMLPLDLCQELDEIKSRRARRAAFDELVYPFCIGTACLSITEDEWKDGNPLPRRVLRELERIEQSDSIPGVTFTTEISGRSIEMSLVFRIDPLIVDYDRKEAYHPVTVGLSFEPADAVPVTPADWPRRDQQTFWKELFEAVTPVFRRWAAERKPEEPVTLDLHARLKVPASLWRPENRAAVIGWLAESFSAAGELEGLQVVPAGANRPLLPVESAKPAKPACPVCGWRHDDQFTQIRTDAGHCITLGGLLPDIVRMVHDAHAAGFERLSTMDGRLQKTCGGYRNPCKAFDDLKQREAYRRLFDTRRRGFIALRGALGRNVKKLESAPE